MSSEMLNLKITVKILRYFQSCSVHQFFKNQFAIMIYSMTLFLSTGSPFHPKVVDPNKVVVVGGWQQILDTKDRVNLVVGEPKRLIFDVSQAGPGMLF